MNNDKRIAINIDAKLSGKSTKELKDYADQLSRIQAFSKGLDKGALKQIDNSAESLKNNNKHLEQIAKNTRKSFSIQGITGFLRSAKTLVTTLGDMSKKSSEYTENINLYQVAFDGATDQADKFINKLTEMYGLDESWLTRTVGTFKQLSNAMGLSVEQGSNLATLMTQMSIDISSLYNTDVDRASTVLQSALAGQTRPIRSLTGADITQNTLQNTLDTMGIERAVSQLSFAEKRLLIIVSLTQQLNQATNDFGKTIESPANQTRILNEQWQRLTRAVGNLFLPILAKILPYLNAILMVLTEIINLVASLFGFNIEDFDYGVSGMSDAFLDMQDSIDGASESAKKLKSGLRGFDKLNVITTPSKGGAGGGAGIDPKIQEAFNKAFDKYNSMLENVRMKANDIRDKMLDWLGFTDGSYKNLKLIAGVLGGIVGAKLITKIAKALLGTNSLLSLSGDNLTVLGKVVKSLKANGWSATIAKIGTKLKTILPVIGKIAGAIGGIVAVILGTSGAYKAMKDLAKGTDEVNKSFGKLAGNTLLSTGGGALVGALIGGVPGAVIGGVIGLITSLTGAVAGYKKGLTELAKSKVFGDLSVSTGQWTSILETSLGSVQRYTGALSSVKSSMDQNYSTFQTSIEQLGFYGLKFSELGLKISETDAVKIKDAIKSMGDSAIEVVDSSTQYVTGVLSKYWEDTGTMTEEERQKELQSLIQSGEDKKSKISSIQQDISTVYDKGIKERGYLTETEKNYIAEQLRKIEEMTNSSAQMAETNMEYYKNRFKNKSLKLDEESYKAYQDARSAYEKTRQEEIEKAYNLDYNRLVQQGKLTETELEKINKTRSTAEQKLKEELTEIDKGVYNDLANHYADIYELTDKESNAQKKVIESIFKDIDIDDSEIISKFADLGGRTCNAFVNTFDQKLKNSNIQLKITTKDDLLKNTNVNGAKVNMSVSSWIPYAQGGLPPVGQLFVANEKGPELVGHIGGQSFVANQNQMMDLLDKKIGNAGGMNNATFIIQVGSKELARTVLTDLQDMAKSNGKPITIQG